MRLLACQALSIAIAATLVSSPAAALADGRSAGYQPAGNGWVDNATDPNATTAAMLADAIRYRTEMGLNAEPDFVATIERDASADRSFGVALTPIELADINARMAVQEAIGPLAEFVDEHSDSLGGWYLDQLKHAQIVILGTSDAGDAISAAQALAPKGATVRVEMVKNPRRALDAAQAQIDAASPSMRAAGVDIAYTGIDPKGNAVEVGVVGGTQDQLDAVAERFGASQVHVIGAEQARDVVCVDRSTCDRPMGGLYASNLGAWRCSSGYWVRGNNSVPGYALLTAGHCYSSSWTQWYVYDENHLYLGSNGAHSYSNGMNADAMLIKSTYTGTRNQVFISATQQRGMTGRYLNGALGQGVSSCGSSAVSGYHCGTIDLLNSTQYVAHGGGPVYTEYHMWRSTFSSSEGDSGGAVLYSYSLQGIIDSVGGSKTYWSTVEWINSTLNVLPCLNATCTS